MESQLSEKQWNQVVAEVTGLAQDREDEQSRRELTEQVLQELSLPTDLIDEALQQVRYREALVKQRRQRIWLGVGGLVLALVIFASVWAWYAQRTTSFANITADAGRVTRTVDNGSNLAAVTRDGQDVFFRATLRDVPLGEKLNLSCNWIDPTGKIFSQSQWATRDTTKQIWETHCRCRIGEAAAKGDWNVQMKLGDRIISTTDFKVE